MKQNHWVWLLFLFGLWLAYLSSTLDYLIAPTLHIQTLLTGLFPFLIFLAPADRILHLFPPFSQISPVCQWAYRLTLSMALAAAFSFLLLTLNLGSPLVLYGGSVLILFLFWGWWKQKILSWYVRDIFTSEGRIEKTLFLLLVIMIFAAALLPPLGYDAHEYHLAVPEEYLQQGHWVAFDDNVYAGFPMNVELLYLWPLAVECAAGCTVINLLIGFIAVLGMMGLAERWKIRMRSFVWLALIFFSCPQVLRLIYHANIDMVLALCAVMVLLAYERLRERGSTLDALLLTVGLGFALGAKYIAVLSILLPFTLILLVDVLWRRDRALFRKGATAMSMAVVLFLPWLIRNFFLYKNPIYPLLTSVFRGEPPIYTEVFRAAHSPTIHSWAQQVISFFVIPWEKMFGENVMTHGFGYLWLLSLPIFFRTRISHPIFKSLLFIVVTYVLWFLVTQRNDRFLASILPFLAIYPLFALDALSESWIHKVMRGVILLVVALQIWFGMMVVVRSETVGYLFQPRFQEHYYSERMPHYRAIDYLNQERSRSLRRRGKSSVGTVLFVGEAQTYGAQFETIAPTVFNHHPLEQGILPDEVTHILYNGSELNRLHNGYGPLGWPLGPVLFQWIENAKNELIEPVYDAYPEKEGTVRVYRVN